MHKIIQAVANRAARPDLQALDRDIAGDHLATARLRKVQRRPATPGADVEDTRTTIEAESHRDVVDLRAGGVAVRAVIAADHLALDRHKHAVVLPPIPITEPLTTLLLPGRRHQRILLDPELERREVAAPELRVRAAYREAPATKVATM
jgi:hypothetical protein